VRKSGGIIIAAKKCTNYGIGATTARLCEIVKNANDSVTIASTMLTGEYGISDVCLSILTVVGGNGVTGRLVAPLTESEISSLQHSAECLKDVIKQLEF
jgi:L-lactate dehydrogenase